VGLECGAIVRNTTLSTEVWVWDLGRGQGRLVAETLRGLADRGLQSGVMLAGGKGAGGRPFYVLL